MAKKSLHAAVLGLCISGCILILYALGLFAAWQTQLSDVLFLPQRPHPDIAIIAIDDISLQKIGRWPWDRSVHAGLLNILENRPAAIGLDVAFPESGTRVHDQALAKALAATDADVLPVTATRIIPGDPVMIRDYLFPIPAFLDVSRAGLVNMVTDQDGITRRTALYSRTDTGGNVANFSVELVRLYTDARGIKMPENIPTEQGLLRINFSGQPGTFPFYSYSDVLDGTIKPDRFDGKIVLIGAAAQDLHDDQLTPVSSGTPMNGVEIHANIINTLLMEKYLVPERRFITVATVVVIGIFATLVFVHMRFIFGLAALFVMLGGYLAYAVLSFDRGIIRSLVFPPATILTAYVAVVVYKYFGESRQKRFIRRAFSYYLSGPVLHEVLNNPAMLKLGGERREITVLFSDITGFTTLSEGLPPEALAALINQYFTAMTRMVFEHEGVLDKYIGDAMMAFWGAPISQPDHALRACRAAIDMREEIAKIQNDWKNKNIRELDVKIGINTGEMVVGNMGSAMRFDYTLLGDNVNLGSRLEGINREYGTYCIIGETTYEHVKDHVIVRRLDTVAVKGKAREVTIYELRGIGKPKPLEKQFLKTFENARSLYEAGKFRMAMKEFSDIASRYPEDKPTRVYISRCMELIRNKPKKWDHVYHLTQK